MFNREETTGTSHACLNFIDNEQGSIPAAKVRGVFEVVGVRQINAFALNGLNDEGRGRS